MAVGEVLTNLAGVVRVGTGSISSCRPTGWRQPARLGRMRRCESAVEAVSACCRELDLSIPVGKDSLSMQTVWHGRAGEQRMRAPVSLIVSGFAPVPTCDARDPGTAPDAGFGPAAAGGHFGATAWAARHWPRCSARPSAPVPDIDEPAAMKACSRVQQLLNRDEQVLACHDRSDGGVLVTCWKWPWPATAE
jgi:phosphoribosylformylglycinamidine synthase